MQWTYVVRSRQRWSSAHDTVERQAKAAAELLQDLGVGPAELAEIARAGMVEVSIPWFEESKKWAERIFPWEYLIAGATRNLRRGQPLTVTRHLNCGETTAGGRASKVLFVTSEPGPLKDRYVFEREQALVRRNLKLGKNWTEGSWNDTNWKALDNPNAEELARGVAEFRPDIVHLAGFDTHLAEMLLLQGDNPAKRGVDHWELETPGRQVSERMAMCWPAETDFMRREQKN